MKVFITWSGERSREIAEIFKEYIPKIIQTCDTFTSEDMGKGEVWFPRLAEEFEECEIGLICLTPENLSEDWILFETGALLSLEEDKSRVCPFLYDLTPSDLDPPLYLFNATENEKEEIKDLFRTINNQLDNSIDGYLLDNAFTNNWSEMKEKLEDVPDEPPKDYEMEEKDESEKMDEMHNLLKKIDKRTTGGSKESITSDITFTRASASDSSTFIEINLLESIHGEDIAETLKEHILLNFDILTEIERIEKKNRK